MQSMLYVSFWDIELSNLPAGGFRRRVLPAAEARRLIHGARASGLLLCVAKEDLGAPYGERARENHRQLCEALREYADIEIELQDFFGENCANQLCLAEVGQQQSLLIVNCHYAIQSAPRESTTAAADAPNPSGEAAEEGVRGRKTTAFATRVAPDSIRFHIIEVVAPAT